jgi:hypothetical protein
MLIRWQSRRLGGEARSPLTHSFTHSLHLPLSLSFSSYLLFPTGRCFSLLPPGENTWKCVWTNIDARDAVYDVKFAPHHLGMKARREIHTDQEREGERERERGRGSSKDCGVYIYSISSDFRNVLSLSLPPSLSLSSLRAVQAMGSSASTRHLTS